MQRQVAIPGATASRTPAFHVILSFATDIDRDGTDHTARKSGRAADSFWTVASTLQMGAVHVVL